MKKVSVIGATGYTGLELVKILIRHKNVKIAHLCVRKEPEAIYSDIFPELKGLCDIKCSFLEPELICRDSDIIFFALPHKVTMTLMASFLGKGKKIIDLSSDYRLNDPDLYNQAYAHEHGDVENIAKFTYGLSEINKKNIAAADNIANPGCFPTSILLALYPVIKENIVSYNQIIVDSKTGVSGGGRTPALGFHFPECNESVKPYKVGIHQHEPEVEQELSKYAKKKVDIIFVPHLIPMTRGLLSTCYCDLTKKKITLDDINALYDKYYKDNKFIRIRKIGDTPQTKDVVNSNFCDIGFQLIDNKLIIISAIDNLIKGASGQAVQNMNIMCGFPDEEGIIN